MGKESKEIMVLELFFNEPSKHWHFKDIVKISKVGKSSASAWLTKFMKEKIIVHHKPKGKMPYFIANFNDPSYINKKKLHGISLLYSSGLVNRLQQLKKAKTIVVFGSFARADWHTGSDVDVFVYGDAEDLIYGTRMKGLHHTLSREIQVHTFKTKKEIRNIKSGLINNVINGHFIKGNVLDLVEVSV